MRARALIALLALSACGSDASTGIVVEVSSDLAVPAAHPFQLRVFTASGAALRTLDFRDGDLPARFQLVPEGAATTVTVEATTLVGSSPLSHRATASFKSGALLLLRLPLNAACVCVTCGEGQTCGDLGCADVVKGALPAYAPPIVGTVNRMAVPGCSGDAGTPASDAGDAAIVMADAARDTPPPLDAGPTDAPGDAAAAPDRPATDLASLADTSPPPPDTSAPPDLATVSPDAAAPPPDLSLPPDSAPSPDLTGPRADGEPCSTSDQCGSRACVDHVCCHTTCVGPCLACDNLHTGMPSGHCAPVLAGTDPDDDCAADVPMSCGYDGLCNGAGACRFYPATTQCASPTCNAASSFTPARTCTGTGACAPPAPKDCGLFLCTPGGCPMTCQSHAACADTAWCNAGTCTAKKAALQPCNANVECTSNSCLLSGVCL